MINDSYLSRVSIGWLNTLNFGCQVNFISKSDCDVT